MKEQNTTETMNNRITDDCIANMIDIYYGHMVKVIQLSSTFKSDLFTSENKASFNS